VTDLRKIYEAASGLPTPERKSLHRRPENLAPRDMGVRALRYRIEWAKPHLAPGPELNRTIILPAGIHDDPAPLNATCVRHPLIVDITDSDHFGCVRSDTVVPPTVEDVKCDDTQVSIWLCTR
jgi:hypothetical protein